MSSDVPSTEQYGKQDVQVEVMSCHISAVDIMSEGWPIVEAECLETTHA